MGILRRNRPNTVRVLQHALETARLACIKIWYAWSRPGTELDRSRGSREFLPSRRTRDYPPRLKVALSNTNSGPRKLSKSLPCAASLFPAFHDAQYRDCKASEADW